MLSSEGKDAEEDGGEPAAAGAPPDVTADASPALSPSTSAPDDTDDYKEVSSAQERPTVLLRLRGLPYGAQERDVLKFFDNRAVAAYICRRAGPHFFLFSVFSVFDFFFRFRAQKALNEGRTFSLACSLARSLPLCIAPSVTPPPQAALRERATPSSPPQKRPPGPFERSSTAPSGAGTSSSSLRSGPTRRETRRRPGGRCLVASGTRS